MSNNARRVPWQEYEQSAFDAFRSTGYHCEKNVILSGARGSHQIDVVVHLDFGINRHRWLVECKHWSRRIGRRDLEAFRTVLDDIGADHGYLLSEAGFQKGAIDMAKTLNISLCSLSELVRRFNQEQLMPLYPQSRWFVAGVVETQDDQGNMDSEAVLELVPLDDLSVSDHIIEIHVIREGVSDWVIPANKCQQLMTTNGRLRLRLPWDPICLCDIKIEEIPVNGGGVHLTGKTKTGEAIDGTYRVVFRTLAGPISCYGHVPFYC